MMFRMRGSKTKVDSEIHIEGNRFGVKKKRVTFIVITQRIVLIIIYKMNQTK